MKKRGISAVVATILIILIVVVGVGIVWKVVLPIFAELEFLSYSDVRLNIVFQGHTVYDSEQHFAFVQIERGKDEVNVTGIEIGFNFDGTTKTYQSDNVPTPNGKYTYKFNFTNDSEFGIPEDVAPDKVTVAPIFTINNKVRLGKILDEKPMPSGRIHLSAEAWKKANDEAAIPIVVTTGSGGGEEPGTPVEPVIPEGPVIICDAQNNSAYDNGTLIETCEYGCTLGVCNEPSCADLGKVDYNGGCAISVTGCGNLNQENEVYELQQDIVNVVSDCINITAPGITFDCNGNSIRSSTLLANVVYSKADGVTIKNCNLEAGVVPYNEGGGTGIRLSGDNSLIENNYITNCHYAILAHGDNNTFINNDIDRSQKSVQVGGNDNLIKGNYVHDSIRWGIALWEGNNNKLINNTILRHRWSMVLVDSKNTFLSCGNYHYNSVVDFYAYNSDAVAVGDNYTTTNFYLGAQGESDIAYIDYDCSQGPCNWTGSECSG